MTRSRPVFRTAVSLAVLTLALTSCGTSNEVGQLEPVTFVDLEDLFNAVDDELDCPETSSDHYGFAVPNHEEEFVHGHTCGDSIIMAHADDPTVITEIQNLITTIQSGPIPIVHNTHWLVVDITEVADDGQATNLEHPESRDLEGLAADWGAAFSRL